MMKDRAAEMEQLSVDLEANAKNDMDHLRAMLDFSVNSIRAGTQKTSDN